MNTLTEYVDQEAPQADRQFLGKIKDQSHACMKIQAGDKILDVGCGSGMDTMTLAHLVGATGEVHGVDFDPAMIREADQHAVQEGVTAWVKHRRANAEALPFETGYFNSARSERLFQHLPNPATVLSEMIRVTKTGGVIAVLDADWGSLAIDTKDTDIERRLAHFHAAQMLNNGFSGRQLYRLLKQHDLEDVSIEVFPVVVTNYAFLRHLAGADNFEHQAIMKEVVSETELNRYHRNLEQADAEGKFFSYFCMTLAFGQKAS